MDCEKAPPAAVAALVARQGVIFCVSWYVSWLRAAGWLFFAGVLLFSGSLYALALGAPRSIGFVTPLGGVCLIFGWLAFAATALRA